MCYYITAVLPPATDPLAAQSIAERHGRNLTPIENGGVKEQLRSGELYCLTTAGHCDCDTTLGLLSRKRQPHQTQKDARARKLEALGWSKTKIERALSQSAQSQERNAARAAQSAAAETEGWAKFIAAVHAAGIPYIGLLLHFYDGALSQNIQLKSRVLLKSSSQATAVLPRIAEDTIYEFRTEA